MNRLRVIFAIFKKDLRQTLRYSTWYINLIIWPLIMPLMYILSAVGMGGNDSESMAIFESATGADNVVSYIVIGTMVWMAVNMIMWSFGNYLRNEQNKGTLESTWLCPINRFDILIGGGLISMLMLIFQAVISVLEYKLIYGITFTGNILEWVVLFLIIMPATFGIGMLFASLILWLKQANATINVIRGAVMILCGISFPITVMPNSLQFLSKLLPFTHGIEAARTVMVTGGNLVTASKSIMICLVQGVIILILGRIAFGFTERKVREVGSLERF